MKVMLFGATGMVGRGVLRECLNDPAVERVLAVGRHPTGEQHVKLRELILPDVADLSGKEAEISGWDACFFCLGVSSAGMSEEQYRKVTYDLTLAVARTLVSANPAMTFTYVSGMGTDSTERGRAMWARVKGKTENDLLRLGFQAAYMFRPGFIIPLHGIKSRTTWTRIFYTVTAPLQPLLKALFPQMATTTEQLGKAMLAVAKKGYPRPVLDTKDINGL